MRQAIKDEFTNLPISRQRKYQLRMTRDRRCTECGEPAIWGTRCLKHLVKARERQRRKRGLKRRYLGTLSYRLQTNPAEVAEWVKQIEQIEATAKRAAARTKRAVATLAKRKK